MMGHAWAHRNLPPRLTCAARSISHPCSRKNFRSVIVAFVPGKMTKAALAGSAALGAFAGASAAKEAHAAQPTATAAPVVKAAKRTRVAIIGCGLIGQKRAKALGAARLTACIDVIPERAEALARTVPGAVAGVDWRAAVSRPDVQIVIVATTNDQLAEITAAGKPAIFVPFPRAADDHQTKNAQALVAANAGVLAPQSELTPSMLSAQIIDLLSHRDRLARMSANARKLSHANAAAQIAGIAINLVV